MSVERNRVRLHVNGEECTVDAAVDEVLAETLRRELGLMSVRTTCGIGICGTCTVLVDDRVASSCLLLTSSVEGRALTTSEGLLGDRDRLHPVQQAFLSHGAYQCSFCIPAMVLTVKAALDELEDPTVEDVREYLGGNLCRCGTYPQILDAAAELIKQRRP